MEKSIKQLALNHLMNNDWFNSEEGEICNENINEEMSSMIELIESLPEE